MKRDPNSRRAWKPTVLAAGLLLATCFVLTPGCGTETPPPAPPVTPAPEPPPAPQARAKTKVKARRDYEAHDDLRERRAKRRLAAQAGA